MNKLRYFTLFILTILSTTPVSAQAEMADSMRADGKIYVVVGIIMIVLFGLILYLFLLDRKVKRLENTLREKRQQTK
jgi:hypothetical protein